MSALGILTELHQRGITVAADGDTLVLKPRRALDDAILTRIREAKPAILKALQETDAERRFGQPHARLFSLIGKRVWTPSGAGELLSVFAEQCEILPEGTTKTIRVCTADVRPIQ